MAAPDLSKASIQPPTGLAYIGIRGRASPQPREDGECIGALCTRALPATFAAAMGAGVQPKSPPVCVYFSSNDDFSEFDMLAGILVDPKDADRLAGTDTPAGRLEKGLLPDRPTANVMYEGPYENLGSVHMALADWKTARGHPPSWPGWEIYHNDPGEVKDPAKFLTEVVSS